MKDGFSVHLEVDKLQKSGRGTISGPVYVTFGGVAFPEADWSDLPVAMILGWLQVLSERLSSMEPFSLRFLDGPFEIRLVSSGLDSWTVGALAEGAQLSPDLAAIVSRKTVLGEVLQACRELLRACDSNGWRSQDLDCLRQLVAARGT
jgi:hypothetical protein